MKKISIKDLVDFRRKSDKSKKTFVDNLKLNAKKIDSSGGDYWISSISTLSNVFRYNDPKLLGEKIEILHEKIESTDEKRTISMYQRNINILTGFTEFELHDVKPMAEVKYLRKIDSRSIFKLNDLPLKVHPNHLYSFNNSSGGSEEIGAIWFVAKLDGYNKMELGMFTDMLYRYLNRYFSSSYYINPSYCVAIDAVNVTKISYNEIENGEVPILLDKTVDEIRKLL